MRTLLIALTAIAPLAAQQPTTDAIPRELALALIDRYGPAGTEAEIVVGRVPPSFPDDALPRSAGNVLGGVERPPGASVVLLLPQSSDTAVAVLVRHLERLRWRAADREREGFVPGPSNRPHSFCRRDVSLTIMVRPRAGGGSLAHLSSWRSPDDPRCDENRRRWWEGGRVGDRVNLPPLQAPSGARMLGSGMGGGGRDGLEAFTRLETAMGSIDLAAHYATQLAGAGWTLTGPTLGEGIVIYGTRRRDKENGLLSGALIVLDIPGSQQRDVVFRAARETPAR